ncbi:MAG TPA: hypothetical protein VGO48_06505 [Conexibacter sp.]|nr:hypothetical protein [Conexibacter sp.]
MRRLADAERIDKLLRALGKEAREETRLYLVGGATMVLNGLRGTTVDVDLRIEPERDDLLRAIARLKEELEVNVELASPSDFVPVPEGRYPAIDPATFRRAAEEAFGKD